MVRDGGRRRRFDPARLLLGMCLLVIAAGFVGRAAGWARVPLRVLVAALPVALVATGVVAVVTYALRHRAAGRS